MSDNLTCIQTREQFVFAVEAAVGAVLHVIRVIELVRFNVFVPNPELPNKRLSVALVRLRN